MNIDEWAAAVAARFLVDLPRRWNHTQGVVCAARSIAPIIDLGDRPVLVAAAYLHDIGYSPELSRSCFHPLDGARWLDRVGYPRLAGLVAHHSGARHEAALRRLTSDVSAYLDERSDVSDALAYCDLTTGPDGNPVTFLERIAEVGVRYGSEHTVARAMNTAAPELAEAVARVQAKLAEAGAAPWPHVVQR